MLPSTGTGLAPLPVVTPQLIPNLTMWLPPDQMLLGSHRTSETADELAGSPSLAQLWSTMCSVVSVVEMWFYQTLSRAKMLAHVARTELCDLNMTLCKAQATERGLSRHLA